MELGPFRDEIKPKILVLWQEEGKSISMSYCRGFQIFINKQNLS